MAKNNSSSDAFSLPGMVARHRSAYLTGALFVLFTSILKTASPFFVRFIVDDIEQGNITFNRMVLFGLSYLLLGIASGACSLFMRYMTVAAGRKIQHACRCRLFKKFTTLDRGFFHRHSTGDLMTRLTSDLNAVSEFLGPGVLQSMRTLGAFLIAFTVMFYLNVKLTLVLLLLLPLMSLVFFVLLRLVGARYGAMQEQVSSVNHFTQESFSGIRTIKGFCMESVRHGLFMDENRELVRRSLKLYRVDRPIWPLMMFLFSLGLLALMIVGGRQVVEGEITLGEYVQFNQYLFMLQWPMLALGWTTNIVQQGLTSWKRIRPLLEQEPAVKDSPVVVESLHEVRGDIVFDDVSLSLSGQTVLHNLSLSIPEGSTLGITGPTGSGKTLLVSLLARLYEPTLGRIMIGHHDLKQYALSVLRRHVILAPQEPFLFSDTLANNITFSDAEADAYQMEWAAQVAHLHNEVQQFPEGYDTMLGEKGITLSGGQRQRTAISRALAAKPTVLILDDVFSAVDTGTEAGILKELVELLGSQTTLLVSHRISTLRNTDQVIVLDGGRIVQSGTHQDLLKQDGYYRHLNEIQRIEEKLTSERTA